MTLVITGANGNLGQKLVAAVGARNVRALVRREPAAELLRVSYPDLDVRIVDYLDAVAMTEALTDAASVVHLVGIIKESGRSRYEVAHEQTSRTLAAAAESAGVGRLINLSIVGSAPDSPNACLRSKGRADQLLLDAAVSTAIVRVPMVLGEGDYASAALKRRAESGFNLVFRADSLEQPIYAGDVIEAVQRLLAQSPFANRVIELGGPESLTRRELYARAAQCLGRDTRVVSLPLGVGMALAGLLERLANPPVTRAMLGVLDHDDQVDAAGTAELGMTLTSLDETLRRCLA